MQRVQILLLAVYLSLTTSAANVLRDQDYAIDILYRTIPNEDPIVYFTIRTYILGSTSFYLSYNISGFANNERYSHSGSGSESSSSDRPVAEHLWFHEYSDEDIRPGDVMIYWLKVKVNNRWLRSTEQRYIIGGTVPTALTNRQQPTTTRRQHITTQRPTPAPRPVFMHTAPPRPPLPPPPPPPPPRAPRPSAPRPPTHRTQPTSDILSNLRNCLARVDFRSFSNCTAHIRGTTSQPLTTTRRPPRPTRAPRPNPRPAPRPRPTPRPTRRPTTTTTVRTTRTTPVATTTTTASTTTVIKPTTTSTTTTAVLNSQPGVDKKSPQQINTHGDGNGPWKGRTPTSNSGSGGDLSNLQAGKPRNGAVGKFDYTIIIISTAIPAVVMIGLIIIVTIIVKNRRANRAVVDPYQQVFNNMNYNSTMEIGSRQPALPPPRVQLRKPTEETEYSSADGHDGDIYEAISHVDYEVNGKLTKPRPPSMHSSQKSSTISAKPPTEWGSDEYEDPETPRRMSQLSRSLSQNHAPNPTYAMYQDPALNSRATLATPRVNNTEYSDTYQDPAAHGRTLPPMSTFAAGNNVYSDTYQDPDQTVNVTPPPVQTGSEPQQTYEVPEASDPTSPTRQYSALRHDESGFSLF